MVAIEEIQNMFWGVTLDGGKRYTQTVETSFHISNAALEVGTNTGEKPNRVAVMIQHEKAEFLLCTLDNKHSFQHSLDLNFTEGEEVTFFLNGKGVVHLTGYLVPEGGPEDYDSHLAGLSDSDDEDEDEDSDEEIPMLKALKSGKRKGDKANSNPKKKLKTELMEEEDDSDDSEVDPSFVEMDSDLLSDEDDDGDSDDSDDEAEDSDDDDDEDDSDEDEDEEDDEDDEEEDEDESEETSDLDMSGSFIQESPNKSKKKKTEGEKTPKSEKKGELKKTPKAEIKAEPKKSPKSEKKEEPKKTPKSEKKQKGKDKTPAGKENVSTGQEASPAKGVTPGKKEKMKDKVKTENAATNGTTPKSEKKKKAKENDGNTPASKNKKVVLTGGTVMEEVKVGNGPEAKSSKMVHVYYKGCLTNGKVFDACTSGKPFKFKLGKQEVIRGWDVGVVGMKVGGKRKLTIPAAQAYGSQRVGSIPPNSALEFQVELKAVS